MSEDNDRIDLTQEIIGLFDQEELLAFFDYGHVAFGEGVRYSIEGLCKISKPKGDDRRTDKLFITFIFDTPNDAIWAKVDNYVNQINWESLTETIDEVESVLAMPTESTSNLSHYFQQIDIFLSRNKTVGRAFLSSSLVDGLEKSYGIHARNLSFWGDLDEIDLAKRIEAIKSGIPSL